MPVTEKNHNGHGMLLVYGSVSSSFVIKRFTKCKILSGYVKIFM